MRSHYRHLWRLMQLGAVLCGCGAHGTTTKSKSLAMPTEETTDINRSDANTANEATATDTASGSSVGTATSSPAVAGFIVDPGSSLQFAPTSVTASRFPSTCGVADPPFKSDDLFSLDLTGSQEAKPYFGIAISFVPRGPALTKTAISMIIDPPNGGHSLDNNNDDPNDSVTQLAVMRGANPNEVDGNPVSAASVTVESVPTSNGAQLALHLSIQFSDGKELSGVAQAPVPAVIGQNGCPQP